MLSSILANISQTQMIVMIVVWLAVLILALIIEAETAEFVSIWFSIGAVPSLICAAFKVEIYIQILVFVIVSAILVLATRPLVKKMTNRSESKTNADRLVGMIAEVTKEIPVGGKGEVLVDFQKWGAITQRNTLIPMNRPVVIKSIVGNKLIVDLIEEVEVK